MSRRNKDRNRTQVAATMSATDAIPSGDSALVSQFMSAMDSYQNGPARLGEGTNNQVNSGAYPLTRITNDYMLMLSLYRSVSVVRRIVDCKAEDILKDFPKLSSQITPQQIDLFEKVVRKTGTLEGLRTALKWGRLFGGGVGLICLKGVKDLMEPLAVEDVEPGSYLGILPLDRWSGVTPGPSLITDISYPPDFGLPEWYACVMGNSVVNVHHTRLLRFTGRELPLWERQTVLYWGLSEVEPIWDSLRINDYTKWNISSLVTRAQIFWMVDKELAAIQSGLGGNNAAFVRRVQRMKALSDAMNNQGLGILGEGGDVKQHTFSFGGLADIREKQMMDLASDAGYPFEILYGRQSGLGSNGESGLQLYYDGIEQARKQESGPKMDKLIPVIAMSTFGEVPDDLDYTWPPVRTMSNKERAELADKTTTAIVSLYNSDLLTKKEARMEQKQASDANGLCSNITDEALAATPDKYASELGGGELDLPNDGESSATDAAPLKDAKGTRDEVAELMERRSFGELATGYNFATYSRHDGDIQLTVRFEDDVVKDVTAVFAGNNDRSKWKKPNSETRKGWEGVWDFAQAYGD